MGVKDQALLEYLEDEGRFADLVNGTMFLGRQVVDPQYLRKEQRKKRVLLKLLQQEDTKENLQSENPQKTKNKEQTRELLFEERERDALMLYDKPGERCLFGCEGQTEADYTMPVRELTYDGIEYSGQVKSREYQTEDEKGTVYPLIPVFNEMLYLGETGWKSKHGLQEMMRVPESMKEFIHLLPDYHVHVADIHEQDPSLFRTEWKDIFRLMKRSRKKEELKAYIEEHMEEIWKLSRETRCFLSILLDQYEILEGNHVEVKEMCQAWDGAMLMYRDEGIQLGIDRGIKLGISQGISEGINQGIGQGISQGKKIAAQNMYRRGASVEDIAGIVEESCETISIWFQEFSVGSKITDIQDA